MRLRIGAAVAAIMAGAAVTAGVGTAAAAPVEAEAATGWVVTTPDTDSLYEIHQGTASVRLAGGTTMTCPVISGWGRASAGTVPANANYSETGATGFGRCAGSPVAGLQVVSAPHMGITATAYDAAADRVAGPAYPRMWGLFLDAPGCRVSLYPEGPNAGVPSSYDNRTATLGIGPIDVVVARADGTACAGLAAVGDEVTYRSTVVATPGFTVRPA